MVLLPASNARGPTRRPALLDDDSVAASPYFSKIILRVSDCPSTCRR